MDYHLQVDYQNLLVEKGRIEEQNMNAEFGLHVGGSPRWRLLHRRHYGMLVVCINKKGKTILEIEIETCNRS